MMGRICPPPPALVGIHSVSEHKKRYIRNYTQILENLRKPIVALFGLRNEFVIVQGNKKYNTQNIQAKKQQKKNNHLNRSVWTNQKGLTELITVPWPRAIKPKSQDNWWCY